MKVQTCKYLPSSSVISDIGITEISECNSITFGDLNKSMVSVERLLNEVDFTNNEDIENLQKIGSKYGIDFLIDLES